MQAPNEFYCPISNDLMQEPVVAADGFSYQEIMIQKWLQKSNISPKTGAELSNKMTVLNSSLKVLINDYRGKHKIESSKIFLDLDKVNQIINAVLTARKHEKEEGNANTKILDQKHKETQRLNNLLKQKEGMKFNKNLKIQRIQFFNGYYIGQLQNGKMNGKGKYVYKSGNIYEGDWKDDKKHGKGKFIYKEGDIYEGDWKDDQMNGKGKFVYKDSDIYEGEWKNDKMNGKGKYVYKSGNIYEGDWKDDKKHGKGKFIYKEGDIYEGDWKDDKMNGKGNYTYKSGNIYEGSWKDDKKHGKGSYVYKNGKVQEEEWNNDKI